MKNLILYIIYKTVKKILLSIPENKIENILKSLSKFVYFIDKKHKKICLSNLNFVFGDNKDENQKEDIIKKSYDNLVYNLYSFLKTSKLNINDYEKFINVVNEKIILELLKNNRKIILITPHFGNWELGSSYFPLKYGNTTFVGRKLNNNYLNKELEETRTRNNVKFLEKNNSSKGLIKALKENRIVGMAIDQNTNKGVKCNFLGKEVIQIDSASRLAIKFDAAILPIFFTMKEFGKYDLEIYKPIEPKNFEGEKQLENITREQTKVMSEHIFKYPEQYFWQHKRFKFLNPELYK